MSQQALKVTSLAAVNSIAAVFPEAQKKVLQCLLNDVQVLRNAVDALVAALPAAAAQTQMTVTTPAAKSVNSVHAGITADSSEATFGAAETFTAPDVARNLRVVMATDWDGGDVVVHGTDQFGAPQTETFTAGGGVTRVGVKVFKTVHAAFKTLVGAEPVAATIGTGDKVGAGKQLQVDANKVLTLVGTGAIAGTWDLDNSGVTPEASHVPDGAKTFTLTCNVSPVVSAPANVTTGA